MDLKTAIRQIKDGMIAPVYLLQGDDYYLQQFVLDQLEQSFATGEKLHRQLMLPDEFGAREIIDNLRHTDLFGSRKLFVLRNAKQIRPPYREHLLEYCRQPVTNHCLAIIDDDFAGRDKFSKDIIKVVTVVDTSKPFESELRKWVQYFFHEKQIKVSRESIDSILGIAGDSVYHIANEIEKICLGVESGATLNPEEIQQFAGWRREHGQWEFLQAVAGRNLSKALVLGQSLLVQGIALLSIVYQLSTLFSELLFLKLSPGAKANQGFVPLPPSVRKRLDSYSKKYQAEELEKALEILGSIDQHIKTTVISEESELTMFLFKVIGGNE